MWGGAGGGGLLAWGDARQSAPSLPVCGHVHHGTVWRQTARRAASGQHPPPCFQWCRWHSRLQYVACRHPPHFCSAPALPHAAHVRVAVDAAAHVGVAVGVAPPAWLAGWLAATAPPSVPPAVLVRGADMSSGCAERAVAAGAGERESIFHSMETSRPKAGCPRVRANPGLATASIWPAPLRRWRGRGGTCSWRRC